MTKKIGVACDTWKANHFRKGLLKAGFELAYDGPAGIDGVHAFRIDVDEPEFEKKKHEVGRVVTQLESTVRRLN